LRSVTKVSSFSSSKNGVRTSLSAREAMVRFLKLGLNDDVLTNSCPDMRPSTLEKGLKKLITSFHPFDQAEILVLAFGNSFSTKPDLSALMMAHKLFGRRSSRPVLHALAPLKG
jgi:hypothetical protein